MNNQQLRQHLDGLIQEVRHQMASADRVLLDVAGAIDRYSAAHAEIQAIGAAIAQSRQPQQLRDPHPPPLTPMAAEQREDEVWATTKAEALARHLNGRQQ